MQGGSRLVKGTEKESSDSLRTVIEAYTKVITWSDRGLPGHELKGKTCVDLFIYCAV